MHMWPVRAFSSCVFPESTEEILVRLPVQSPQPFPSFLPRKNRCAPGMDHHVGDREPRGHPEP
jgi:hypothetical protein